MLIEQMAEINEIFGMSSEFGLVDSTPFDTCTNPIDTFALWRKRAAMRNNSADVFFIRCYEFYVFFN